MQYLGQILTLSAGVFGFITGALVKNRKWLMICIVITAILAVAGIAIMINNYTDWFNSLGVTIRMFVPAIPKIMYG